MKELKLPAYSSNPSPMFSRIEFDRDAIFHEVVNSKRENLMINLASRDAGSFRLGIRAIVLYY